MLKITGIFAVTTAITLAGCGGSTTTRTGGFPALVSNLQNGNVSQTGQTASAAQTAAGTPNVTNILGAVNTANGTSSTTPVSNALTPANIAAAVNAALAANAAKQGSVPTNPNAIGPGPIFGPAGIDAFGSVQGPAAFKIIPPGN